MKSTLLGHKGRCFDLKTSHSLIISSSEDGTSILWKLNASRQQKIFQFNHSKDRNEVLRANFLTVQGSLICTCGADGRALIWREVSQGKYKISHELEHEGNQIYACERLSESNINNDSISDFKMLTATDDKIIIWEINFLDIAQPAKILRILAFNTIGSKSQKGRSDKSSHIHTQTEKDVNGSFHFEQSKRTRLNDNDETLTESRLVIEESFGGPRNPDKLAYVFDVKPSHGSLSKLAVALSDSTVRVVDVNEETDEIIVHIASQRSYVTAVKMSKTYFICSTYHSNSFKVSWDSEDKFIFAALGSGQVVVIDITKEQEVMRIDAHSKPCYGAMQVKDALICSGSTELTLR
jgi:WD40 repeat protein